MSERSPALAFDTDSWLCDSELLSDELLSEFELLLEDEPLSELELLLEDEPLSELELLLEDELLSELELLLEELLLEDELLLDSSDPAWLDSLLSSANTVNGVDDAINAARPIEIALSTC